MPEVTVATFNIRKCRGTDDRTDVRRVSRVIRYSGAQVVALQEVDGKRRFARRGQDEALARLTEMQVLFGPAFDDYGNAILSKLGSASQLNTPLPAQGEPRSLLQAQVLIGQVPLVVVATHLGLGYSQRAAQVSAIGAVLDATPGPVVLAADLNSTGADLEPLWKMGFEGPAIPTYPADRPVAALDRVLGAHGARIISAQALATDASDHLPLVARVAIAEVR